MITRIGRLGLVMLILGMACLVAGSVILIILPPNKLMLSIGLSLFAFGMMLMAVVIVR